MAVRLLPDVERLVSGWLRAHADLTALVGSRIYTEIPRQPNYPLVRFERVGGTPSIPNHLDVARVQFEAWAAKKVEARDLAATLYAVVHQLPGVHPEGVVTAVEDTLGFSWQPDASTGRPRYLFDVLIYAHP